MAGSNLAPRPSLSTPTESLASRGHTPTGGIQGGCVVELADEAAALEAHRPTDVNQETQGAVRLGLQLAHVRSVVAAHGPAVEQLQVVPGNIALVATELDARALA